jgi:hypothetical protein
MNLGFILRMSNEYSPHARMRVSALFASWPYLAGKSDLLWPSAACVPAQDMPKTDRNSSVITTGNPTSSLVNDRRRHYLNRIALS